MTTFLEIIEATYPSNYCTTCQDTYGTEDDHCVEFGLCMYCRRAQENGSFTNRVAQLDAMNERLKEAE